MNRQQKEAELLKLEERYQSITSRKGQTQFNTTKDFHQAVKKILIDIDYLRTQLNMPRLSGG